MEAEADHLEQILIGIFSVLLAVMIVLGILLYFKRNQIAYWSFQNRAATLLVRPTVVDNGFPLLKSVQQVLLVYDGALRDRVAILRQQLSAAGVANVYDYHEDPAGTANQQESYWFNARIHDPSVGILVILSADFATSSVMDQLSSAALADRSSLNRRIFIIT